MSLQISIRESGDVTILDLRGHSTIEGGSELLNLRLKESVAKGARKFLLNLEELTQIDSTGVSVITGTSASLKNQGGDLKLLRPRGRVLEVIRVLHLADIVPCFEDETEALASFEGRGSAASP